MTLHQFTPLIPVAVMALVGALSSWNLWRMKRRHRARGRRMIEQRLADRGETAVAIKPMPRAAFHETAGLSAAEIFEVRAETAGEDRTYQWAYAPRVFPWQTEGLQRLNHGVWIPA